MTVALGIHQSDVIIKSAITTALENIRSNPWLLDYCFANLPQDSLTAEKYGLKSVEQAKNWFLNTKIPVFVIPRLDEAKLPAISIQLQSSQEAETTLSDVHYQVTEDATYIQRPALTDPFTPESYVPSTGVMTLTEAVAEDLVLGVGLFVVTKTGNEYEITEILDDRSFVLRTNINDDFGDVVIKGPQASYVASLESASYKETYVIGCHVSSEPIHCVYLHSILKFALLVYKQALLEARGFERTTINSTDLRAESGWEGAETAFARYLQVTGFVRQYWPKDISPKITAVEFQPRISDIPEAAANDEEFNSLPWLGVDDEEDGDTTPDPAPVL